LRDSIHIRKNKHQNFAGTIHIDVSGSVSSSTPSTPTSLTPSTSAILKPEGSGGPPRRPSRGIGQYSPEELSKHPRRLSTGESQSESQCDTSCEQSETSSVGIRI
jgi:hypothetical protein